MFKKSPWGTSRYVYNLNNPVGLFLALASLVFAGVMVVLMETDSGPFEPPKQTPWSPPVDDHPTYDFGPPPEDDATESASPSPSPSPSDIPSPTQTQTQTSTPTRSVTPSPTLSLGDGMNGEGRPH
ncbi:hypothetical protein [Streptomyces luteolus]|uniref:Uncharacterized protein n=1 Tax=Streptomyces luteolus TaxID=3043615 RepID=A0ABT6SZ02_9ACTN|nr:hypothetical protein [Streptomyces sp. B-S-A12]MDI3420353.1 hypothetical protein [Streptomyces sp. B-S-A12]